MKVKPDEAGGERGGRRWAWASWLGRAALDLLFPPRCLVCDADMELTEDRILLCRSCRGALGPEQWSGCHRCGAAVEVHTAEGCPHCRPKKPFFDSVIPLGSYGGMLREAVLRVKRSSGDPLACALASLLVLRRGESLESVRPDWIVPIPMHWRRRLLRGYNSPEAIARVLSLRLGVPRDNRLLFRTRNTRLQPDLTAGQRFKNVRGAFAVRTGRNLQNARVLLVDDVLTTGATSSEAARTLKRAGAGMVAVAVFARAEGDAR